MHARKLGGIEGRVGVDLESSGQQSGTAELRWQLGRPPPYWSPLSRNAWKDLLSTLLALGVVAAAVALAFLSSSACGWSAITVLVLFPLAVFLRTRAKVWRMSTADLEKLVWHYEPYFFSQLGEDEECVVEFRRIVERRNLAEMKARWEPLSSAFDRLAKEAGISGRDLVDCYPYSDQSAAIAELVRRSRKATRREDSRSLSSRRGP